MLFQGKETKGASNNELQKKHTSKTPLRVKYQIRVSSPSPLGILEEICLKKALNLSNS